MSSSPSSNTAKSPAGPAPMITTSVLIVSVILLGSSSNLRAFIELRRGSMGRRAAQRARLTPSRPAPSFLTSAGKAASALLLGGFDDKPLEFRCYFDLAREPGIRLHFVGKIEHVLFLLGGLADEALPFLIDIDMARAQAQPPPHSAVISGIALRMAASITVEPSSASTVRASPNESIKVILTIDPAIAPALWAQRRLRGESASLYFP